jgi:hypothetical protein
MRQRYRSAPCFATTNSPGLFAPVDPFERACQRFSFQRRLVAGDGFNPDIKPVRPSTHLHRVPLIAVLLLKRGADTHGDGVACEHRLVVAVAELDGLAPCAQLSVAAPAGSRDRGRRGQDPGAGLRSRVSVRAPVDSTNRLPTDSLRPAALVRSPAWNGLIALPRGTPSNCSSSSVMLKRMDGL